MSLRVSKENYYLDIAQTVAERCTCLRRRFGAIIVKNDVILSTGYNGAPRQNQNHGQNRPQRSAAPVQPAAPKTADQIFEEKLKAFMTESDSKLSSIRAEHRTKTRRR